MNLEAFTHVTLAVLEEQRGQHYAPTLVVEGVIQVIEGIPEGLDHRDALQDLVGRMGLADREFLFGLRTAPGEITTGHYSPMGIRAHRITEMAKGYSLSPEEDCTWWRFPAGPEQ